MPIRCVVGLGNPGSDYEHTRHNAGAWFLKRLAESANIFFKHEKKFHAHIATWVTQNGNTSLLIPTTYMNESGLAVGLFTRFYQILPTEILVVHDELDLPSGTIRLKQGGGHAGHNGLRDIINHLGSPNFLRLRIGIDHDKENVETSDYVLSKPSKIQKDKINQAIENALLIMPDILTDQFTQAMQKLHTTKKEESDGI